MGFGNPVLAGNLRTTCLFRRVGPRFASPFVAFRRGGAWTSRCLLEICERNLSFSPASAFFDSPVVFLKPLLAGTGQAYVHSNASWALTSSFIHFWICFFHSQAQVP